MIRLSVGRDDTAKQRHSQTVPPLVWKTIGRAIITLKMIACLWDKLTRFAYRTLPTLRHPTADIVYIGFLVCC